MTRVALIEYFTSSTQTLIFVVKPDLDAPLVFEAKHPATGKAVTQEHLRFCAQRLLVDFHGLPRGWDNPATEEHFKRDILSLPPAISALKRGKELKERYLFNPSFAYELTYWQQLSDALLPAALREQINDCELLCIVPHGPLHSLPFSALRWSSDQFLIERFGVSQVQSAGVLRFCQAKNRRRGDGANGRPSSCLIAAVAAADDEQPQEFEADGETLAAFFQDDGTGRVTRLIGNGSSSTNGGQAASKENIRREVGGHDVVHLACHGFFGEDAGSGDPLDSGLLVSDGQNSLSLQNLPSLDANQRAPFFLTAREAFDLPLCADLVTLRACSSGRSALRSGDELLGLTRAFLYAGAPSLLVSLWNVNKHSSQLLLGEFYRLWLDPNEPLPKWRALQEAQRKLLSDARFAHPYHWAPFILLGDWV